MCIRDRWGRGRRIAWRRDTRTNRSAAGKPDGTVFARKVGPQRFRERTALIRSVQVSGLFGLLILSVASGDQVINSGAQAICESRLIASFVESLSSYGKAFRGLLQSVSRSPPGGIVLHSNPPSEKSARSRSRRVQRVQSTRSLGVLYNDLVSDSGRTDRPTDGYPLLFELS